MQKRQKQNRQPRRGKKKGGARRSGRAGPAEFVATLALVHKFRFTSSSAAGSAVTRGMLLNLVSMATTTTNQNRLFTAVRLRRIQIWGQPPALGSATQTAIVEWLGNQAPSTIHSDSSIGIRPARIDTTPPADGSERWWSISGANESETLANLSVPVGGIIDVTLEMRLADDEGAVAAENGTGASATIGKLYYNYLDSFASKHYAPVGGITILP